MRSSLMPSSTSLALAALGLVAFTLPATAGTLLVPQQYPTIQKALNAAKPYDTVLVSAKPGGAYSEAITISTPHLVLQGVGNPILDGSKLAPLSRHSLVLATLSSRTGLTFRQAMFPCAA